MNDEQPRLVLTNLHRNHVTLSTDLFMIFTQFPIVISYVLTIHNGSGLSRRVYKIGYSDNSGVVDPQLSRNGFPMDCAMVAIGSHNLTFWN
jgi:hypothetical protein